VRRLLERATRSLVRRGVRDGLLGGNGLWLAAGAVAWLVRWLSRSPPPRVVREQIRLGETITVSSVAPPPFGRNARKLARAEQAAAKAARRQVRSERTGAELAGASGSAGHEAEAKSRRSRGGRGGRGGGGRSARATA